MTVRCPDCQAKVADVFKIDDAAPIYVTTVIQKVEVDVRDIEVFGWVKFCRSRYVDRLMAPSSLCNGELPAGCRCNWTRTLPVVWVTRQVASGRTRVAALTQ